MIAKTWAGSALTVTPAKGGAITVSAQSDATSGVLGECKLKLGRRFGSAPLNRLYVNIEVG